MKHTYNNLLVTLSVITLLSVTAHGAIVITEINDTTFTIPGSDPVSMVKDGGYVRIGESPIATPSTIIWKEAHVQAGEEFPGVAVNTPFPFVINFVPGIGFSYVNGAEPGINFIRGTTLGSGGFLNIILEFNAPAIGAPVGDAPLVRYYLDDNPSADLTMSAIGVTGGAAQAVPEPTTIMLLSGSLAVLISVSRRRRAGF